MIEDILGLVSDLGNVVNTANGVIDLVQKVKGMMQQGPPPSFSQENIGQTWGMPPMQPFRPATQDPFQGGQQFLPQLKQMAAQFGNPWVAPQTQGIMGIDLTGIWSPPMNPYDQTYIRQYGPYLNVIAGVGGAPTFYGEGLFNPGNGFIHVIGRNMQGAFGEAQARLLPNWVIQGVMILQNPWGMPMQFPLSMGKVG